MAYRQARGVALLGLLFLVAILGVSLAAAGIVWQLEAKRHREQELLFIGAEFRAAIGRYYEANAKLAERYPKSLEVLLKDPNHLVIRRHLRRLYVDPLTRKPDWGLMRNLQGGIVGVYSLSADVPVKRANFAADDAGFSGARSYRDWRFIWTAAPAADRSPPQTRGP